jgi:hypothetical protein
MTVAVVAAIAEFERDLRAFMLKGRFPDHVPSRRKAGIRDGGLERRR